MSTVRLEIGDEGRAVSAGSELDREMVSHHSAAQTAGGPWEPRPTMKFHNPWAIRTPPGRVVRAESDGEAAER